MSSLDQIISNLEMELQQLLAAYKEQIVTLELENKNLRYEIEKINNEKSTLLEELRNIKNSKPLIEKNHSYSSSTLDHSLLLLSEFNESIEKEDLETVHYSLELLCKNPIHLPNDDSDIRIFVNNIFHLVKAIKVLENEFIDKIVANFFKLLSTLRSKQTAYLTHFLKENYPELLDCSLNLNEPKTIIRFLKLLMDYQFEVELAEALSHIIKVEWSFLDFNVSKAEFCFFLWYAYLFDLDGELLVKTHESKKWLDVKNSVFQLYSYLLDCIKKQKVKDKKWQNELIQRFKQNKVFNMKETERILEKVHYDFDNIVITKDPLKFPTYEKALHMVDTVKLNQLIIDLQLKKKDVFVPIYSNKSLNIFNGEYHNVTVYLKEGSKKKKKAFITFEDVEEIHKKVKPGRIKAVKYVEPQTKKTINKPIVTIKWPSTDLRDKPKHPSQEQTALNENSELKKQGYQITGLTRAERWSILQKAVPALGLKKVAYTIANNIRLRKGQKNGQRKFSYAIGEWELDLAKLKKTYYQKDFTWPSY
ncbi:hypothetical protein [Neobacillus mesonae]|uniref:hypothetical protein n=1 Tax=Neobacillus mesonae TaxID=1193713 RepID=UPI00203A54D2|nr:hypothetical protein [Neobacillus mesonae]MCM3569311.1 hypothetical protein [Neobacillus mesonae]